MLFRAEFSGDPIRTDGSLDQDLPRSSASKSRWGAPTKKPAQMDRLFLEWRGQDLNLRPRGYEPRELPGCSTPRQCVDVDNGSISVSREKGSQ